MSSKELPAPIKREVDEIIENHLRKKYFVFGSKFSRENALTLLAIQEGISSRLQYDISRGHGLTDFVEHCFELSPEAKVVIISGSTAIKIDQKYKLKPQRLFGRTRRVIALNEANDIFDKPDPNYVRNLSVNFPGVIIETTIPLKFQ